MTLFGHLPSMTAVSLLAVSQPTGNIFARRGSYLVAGLGSSAIWPKFVFSRVSTAFSYDASPRHQWANY